MRTRIVNWLDMTDAVAPNEVNTGDAYSPFASDANVFFDGETGMAFTLVTESVPISWVVAETLDQYEPEEL